MGSNVLFNLPRCHGIIKESELSHFKIKHNVQLARIGYTQVGTSSIPAAAEIRGIFAE